MATVKDYVTPFWLRASGFDTASDNAESHEEQAEACWELGGEPDDGYYIYVKLFDEPPTRKLRQFRYKEADWVVRIMTDQAKVVIREKGMRKSRFLEALKFAGLRHIAFKMQMV